MKSEIFFLQYAGINIGPVHKKDVMKASVMLEHDPQYVIFSIKKAFLLPIFLMYVFCNITAFLKMISNVLNFQICSNFGLRCEN